MGSSNETNLHRAARALSRSSDLSYQQARQQLLDRRSHPVRSVYVTTVDGHLGEVTVDGDVLVATIDWTTFDVGPVADPAVLLGSLGLPEVLPSGLALALTEELALAGWLLDTEFPCGPDRPWALVTFVDETFASGCFESSAEVEVVYHDWSLWFADLAIGAADEPSALLTEALDSVGRLGPLGTSVAREHIELYRAAVTRYRPGR